MTRRRAACKGSIASNKRVTRRGEDHVSHTVKVVLLGTVLALAR